MQDPKAIARYLARSFHTYEALEAAIEETIREERKTAELLARELNKQLSLTTDERIIELEKERNELSKQMCEWEDWLLGTKETSGALDCGQRLKERIRDLISAEGERGDLKERVEYLEEMLTENGVGFLKI